MAPPLPDRDVHTFEVTENEDTSMAHDGGVRVERNIGQRDDRGTLDLLGEVAQARTEQNADTRRKRKACPKEGSSLGQAAIEWGRAARHRRRVG
jgi:hypothetical protein